MNSIKLNGVDRVEGMGSKTTKRPPIAILGVPFDNVTKAEAVALVEEMIASREPHYLVTPNVDFLVQARKDVELRRILFEAHLVLCDGTPLVWASRLLGNALPERVAGADLVPMLTRIAAEKKYRLFLLGATAESAERAVSRLHEQFPELIIAGHYSPPFNQLLEMDHEEIKSRVLRARPDLLFVSFGCPKQEKWVAMHYRSLGVPVTAGVGATIDFLAGQVRRAPVWMQRSGTEWIFRLAQEPRRLFRRYFTDLWIFGTTIFPQWWELQVRPGRRHRIRGKRVEPRSRNNASFEKDWYRLRMPQRLDIVHIRENTTQTEDILRQSMDCILDMRSTTFVDSTGVGWLIRVQKRLRVAGHQLVLLRPTPAVLRALRLMRLTDFFQIAADEKCARRLLRDATEQRRKHPRAEPRSTEGTLVWRGEVTAANADSVWEYTLPYLSATQARKIKTIDLSQVRFIDSTGLGLMVRAKKRSLAQQETLRFIGLQPAVRNVLSLSHLEDFLLGPPLSAPTPVLSNSH